MSDPKQILAQRILLPELELLEFKYRGPWCWIKARKESSAEVCPRCAVLSESIYDSREIEVRDEPFRGKFVVLKIVKRRFECKPCGKVFSEPVPGVLPRRRTTQRYRRAVLEACERFTSLSLVRKVFGCSSSLIYGALYEQLELKRRTRQYPWPEVLGIDEISFRRNKRLGCTEFASVIVDVKNKRVMELVQGKRTKDLFEALKHIPGRENVRWVAIDMCDPFRAFVREFFPNAKLVADKFHALRLLSPTILRVLKEEFEGSTERWKMRKYMLRRPDNMDFHERSRLYRFLEKSPKLKALYIAKERLFSLYATKWGEQAKRGFEKLVESLKASPFEELNRLGRTLRRWENEVLNYFQRRLTNGRTEGFNCKIKLVKRMAYGYRSFRNFRLRVLMPMTPVGSPSRM